MFRNFDLTFTPEVAEYVKMEYGKANDILEYGSGGSTMYAASQGKRIITTESSATWLVELMGAFQEKKLSGNIIPLWCDIGETKEFGYPVDQSKWDNWPSYPLKAWRYCAEHNIKPDLVLVDGRFRVASFITSCVRTKVPVRILFDDFV